MSIKHLSPSTISSYRNCGRQVYFKKIKGIPDTTSYAATGFGSAMHRVLELAMRGKKEGTLLTSDELKDIFIKEYTPLAEKTTVWRGENKAHMIEQGLIACQDFYDNWYDKYEPLHIEFEFNIDRGEEKLPIKTISDLITPTEVIDFKFGRSSRPGNYLTAMTTYCYCFYNEFGFMPKVKFLMAKWNKRKVDGKYKFFFNKFEELVLPVKEDWFETFNKIYDTVEAGIKANIFLPVQDGNTGLCKECSYRKNGYCDMVIF